MLRAAVAILLFLLPSQVNALITTDAKCLAGYDWMFSSIGQSPCDVAAELASVCNGGPFNLPPLPVGYVYVGPPDQNSCRCSSVFYSLLSGCSYCQNHSYIKWSLHVTNCTMIYTVYPKEIPAGVKVPAYAYQDVSISDTFNATLAYNMKGIESSRSLPPSTQIPTPTSTSASLAAASSTTAINAPAINAPAINAPAIVGGVVGGLVGLGLIAALIIFLVLRSKQKSRSQNQNSSFPQSPNMVHTPDTTSLIHSASPPPGSPGIVYSTNPSTYYSFPDPNTYDPHRQHSPPINQNVTPNFTGNSAHNYVPLPTIPQNTGSRSHDPFQGVHE